MSKRQVQPRAAPPPSDCLMEDGVLARTVSFDVRFPAAGVRAAGPRPRVRAAFLTPTLLMGGAERWMISLARCCDRRRIEWVGTALTARAPASPLLCKEMATYMPIHADFQAGPLSASPYIHYWRSSRAALEAATREADVLVTWGVPDLGRLVGGLGIPIVFVSHGSGDPEWSARTIHSSEAGATHFVAVSEPARSPFRAGVQERTTIIHNGIDVERSTPTVSREETRAAWGVEQGHRVIGYVGRFSGEKNPSAAARAAHALGGNFRAVYVGEGWMEENLRREIEAFAGDRVRFAPMDRITGNALSAIDVFMLASPAEGFSLSMAEAWWNGTPVVATRVGAVPELERRHGQLVAPVPIDASADALARGVEMALEPRFSEQVVPRARRMVHQFHTAGAMAAQWTEYLYSIVMEELR